MSHRATCVLFANLSPNAAATLSADKNFSFSALNKTAVLTFSVPRRNAFAYSSGEGTATSSHRYPGTITRPAIPAHSDQQPPVKLPAQYWRISAYHGMHFILHWSDIGYPWGASLSVFSHAEMSACVGSVKDNNIGAKMASMELEREKGIIRSAATFCD
jgi:hypothetical protein